MTTMFTYGQAETSLVDDVVGGEVEKDEDNHVGDTDERDCRCAISVAIFDGTSHWLQRNPGDLVRHGREAINR